MSDGCPQRESARGAIQLGKLPNRRPDRIWGGPGVGADRTICKAPLERDDLELEIEFAGMPMIPASPGTMSTSAAARYGMSSAAAWIGLPQTPRILFALIMRITNNRETAEELTVDVFHDV